MVQPSIRLVYVRVWYVRRKSGATSKWIIRRHLKLLTAERDITIKRFNVVVKENRRDKVFEINYAFYIILTSFFGAR